MNGDAKLSLEDVTSLLHRHKPDIPGRHVELCFDRVKDADGLADLDSLLDFLYMNQLDGDKRATLKDALERTPQSPSLSPPAPEGGYFRLPVAPEALAKALAIVDDMHAGTEVAAALERAGESPRPLPPCGGGGGAPRRLVVLYSDFEIDDVMAMVQLWQWKSAAGELDTIPLVIFCADFAWKECGKILEKKQLMSTLMLGTIPDLHILTKEGDDGSDRAADGSEHPRTRALAEARAGTLATIGARLRAFEGDLVDFYLFAPGRGNIGAILAELSREGAWPTKAKWKLTMYSGSYNSRGMTDVDMAAIDAIAAHSDSPLVDMSRFPFFGGKEALAPSASLGSWVLPEFAARLAEMDPLLAAALRIFHDEFSQGLIHPDNPNVFKGHELSGDERERLKALKAVFDSSGVEAYARGLRADEGLWNKVVDYKQPTVSAFAVGACDGPLCDQLLFMGEWMAKEQPTWLKADIVGQWKADRSTGYTSVVVAAGGGDAGGPRAVQPSLRRPKDEGVTQRLREVTQEYVFRHLAAIRGGGGWAPG